MSILRVGPNGADLSNVAIFSGATASRTIAPTLVTINLTNGDRLLLEGQFVAAGDKISSGTITGIEMDHPGTHLFFTVEGLNLSIQSLSGLSGTEIGYLIFPPGSTIIGTSTTDVMVWQNSDTNFIGGDGTETYIPGPGNNSITGGSGVNIAKFSGLRSSYTITDNHDGSITVADSFNSRNGSTHISSVGDLQFLDQNIIVADGAASNIALLYSAAFGRIPDDAGLRGWEKIFQNNVSDDMKQQGVFVALAETSGKYNGSLSIAAGFTQSTEFQQRYGTLDDTSFVGALYHNVLGRDAEASGLQSWLNLMHNGDSHGQHFTREMVLVGIAESQENIAKDTGSWLYIY